MKSDTEDYYYPIDGDVNDKYNHPMSQAEERLTTTSKFIPHADKFIKCIDIYVHLNEFNEKDFNDLRKLDNLAKKRNIVVNYYTNFDYFSRQYEDCSWSLNDIAHVLWN